MQIRFELNHQLPLPRARVQNFLGDLQAFGELHPLMERVENLGSSRYMIHEFKPLLFGLKARFKYAAVVHDKPAEHCIIYEAKTQGITIEIRFDLRMGSADSQTSVMETVSISGSRLFLGILKRAIIENHNAVFLRLRDNFQ